MNRFAAASAALLASTAIAQAGGIERNAFGTAIFFEQGNYVELSYSTVDPDVRGTLNAPAPAVGSGDMAPRFGFATLSYHNEISDNVSLVLVLDEPIGADVRYPAPYGAYPFALSQAEIRSQQVTVGARYQLENNISVFGGLRIVQAEGVATVNAGTAFSYSLDSESDTGYGYMVGVAYELPDIALRVALSYFSEVDLTFTGREGAVAPGSATPPPATLPASFNVTLPDSLLLEAQTGVAEGTLVFGSVRWVDWSEFVIDPAAYPAPSPLVSYSDDTITYTLGVARRLTDDIAVLGSLNYEAGGDGTVSNLGPTDGRFGLGLGARYTAGPWELSGGVSYTWLQPATTSISPPITASFNDNSVLGFGIRVGYRF